MKAGPLRLSTRPFQNARRHSLYSLAIHVSAQVVAGSKQQTFKAGQREFCVRHESYPGIIIRADLVVNRIVTQSQWREVMGNNPSRFSNCGDTCLVDSVSWDDIQIFLQKLNARSGKQYRLPTEAEWEYACYGGSKTEYCGSNDLDAVGWYGSNSGATPHPVGQKQPNGYGLPDMSGTVWEWMVNCFNGSCGGRALRGGSWYDFAVVARAALRIDDTPANRSNFSGFRVARTLP